MDQNNKDENIGQWVDDRMAALDASSNRSANSSRAFERLNELKEGNVKRRKAATNAGGRLWMAVAVSVVICFVFAAVPWRLLKNVVLGEKGPALKVSDPLQVQNSVPVPLEVPAASPRVKTAEIAKSSAAALTVVPSPIASEISVQGATEPPPSPPQTAGPQVSPPRVLKQTEPDYTDEARRAHIQGTIVIDIAVHKDGTATVVKILEGLGYGLDENAKAAVAQWEFAPATVNGQPTEVRMKAQVNFHLK